MLRIYPVSRAQLATNASLATNHAASASTTQALARKGTKNRNNRSYFHELVSRISAKRSPLTKHFRFWVRIHTVKRVYHAKGAPFTSYFHVLAPKDAHSPNTPGSGFESLPPQKASTTRVLARKITCDRDNTSLSSTASATYQHQTSSPHKTLPVPGSNLYHEKFLPGKSLRERARTTVTT